MGTVQCEIDFALIMKYSWQKEGKYAIAEIYVAM